MTMKNLKSDDYFHDNHPVSTLADAAHLSLASNGRSKYIRNGCLNFLSRTFAYKGLLQGPRRALALLSSFVREYLGKVITADQWAPKKDDISQAVNEGNQLIKHLRATLECIRNAGLELTMQRCDFAIFLEDHLRMSEATDGDNCNLLREDELPIVQGGFTMLSWVP